MKDLGVYIGIVNEKVMGADGNPSVNKKAVFKFWSDEETSSKIASMFPKLVRRFKEDGRAIIVELPVEVAEKFIGGKFWGNLINEYQKNGYQLKDTPDDVRSKMEFAMNQSITDSDKKNAVSDLNKYIDDIVNGLEKDYNDPRFKSLMSSITVLNTDLKSDGGYAFKKYRPSVRNLIMMLTQWRKAGRQGHPTFVTTQNIWERVFKREVVPGAVKLLVNRPSNVTGQSSSDAMSQMGVTSSDVDRDASVKFAFEKHKEDKNYGNLGQNNLGGDFNLILYYDVSDTELMTHAQRDYFQDVRDAENVDMSSIMKDGMQGAQSDEAYGNFENMPENEAALWKGIVRYANESGDRTIRSMIAAKRDLFSILTALVGEESDIDREHDEEKKKMIINTVLFALCRHYGIFEDKLGYLYNNGLKFVNSENGKVDKRKFIKVMPYVYNVIDKIGNIGIKESMSLMDISKLICEGENTMSNIFTNFNNILNRMALTD